MGYRYIPVPVYWSFTKIIFTYRYRLPSIFQTLPIWSNNVPALVKPEKMRPVDQPSLFVTWRTEAHVHNVHNELKKYAKIQRSLDQQGLIAFRNFWKWKYTTYTMTYHWQSSRHKRSGVDDMVLLPQVINIFELRLECTGYPADRIIRPFWHTAW
jgi:hypothetical protein